MDKWESYWICSYLDNTQVYVQLRLTHGLEKLST